MAGLYRAASCDPMKVGYCVPILPILASYRLRVAIPSEHLGCDYAIGCTGRPTFFFKNGNSRLAEALTGGVVYDVVNDHFRGKHAADYHAMCSIADKITCGSEIMAETVMHHTGRESTVIDDPYENAEAEPRCKGNTVLWFGHSANLASLVPHLEAAPIMVCSDWSGAHVKWSRDAEDASIAGSAVVLLTSSSRGASANRVVKAIRAGRFVVAPDDCPESWRELSPYMHIGDVSEGIRWALNNREESCKKTLAGQHYIQQRYSPQLIGSQWAALFAST